MKIIWHWILLAGAMYLTAYLLPSRIGFSPIYIVLVVSAVLMFINATVKPIISLLTLPINLLTLGLFGIFLNGLIIWALTFVIPGFTVGGFISAVIAGLIIAVMNWILGRMFK